MNLRVKVETIVSRIESDLKLIVIVMILAFALSTITSYAVFAMLGANPGKSSTEDAKPSQVPTFVPNTKPPQVEKTVVLTPGPYAAAFGEGLSEGLRACKPSEIAFVHPVTGESFTRTISAESDVTCKLVETMPRGRWMSCLLNETQRNQLADFYTAAYTAKTLETWNNKYVADGTQIEVDVNTFLQSKTCVIGA